MSFSLADVNGVYRKNLTGIGTEIVAEAIKVLNALGQTGRRHAVRRHRRLAMRPATLISGNLMDAALRHTFISPAGMIPKAQAGSARAKRVMQS
ncbi:hypothetical protein [Paraburkholderia sp. BL21I4N1]|uniref:hypothetical protein n=1 Tax=Paraburkholderia sp. BL21I4N1 TaxID=1938801 RepID=UPI0035BE48A7